MRTAIVHRPDATVTLAVVNPSIANDAVRMASALGRLRPEEFDAWQAGFEREIDRSWARAVATQRRLRNGNLMLGIAGLLNAPNMARGLGSDSTAIRAASVAGLLAMVAGFSMAAWSTYEMAMKPRLHGRHQD